MAKLDHSKGGYYELDPARVQRTNDFDAPDDMAVKGKSKRKREVSTWGEAMKAVRRAEIAANGITLTQDALLTLLGVRRRRGRPINHAHLLKQLTGEGLLLANGNPNLDHPKVIELMSQQRRAKR